MFRYMFSILGLTQSNKPMMIELAWAQWSETPEKLAKIRTEA